MQLPHVLDEDRKDPRGADIPCHKSIEVCKGARLRSGPQAETCISRPGFDTERLCDLQEATQSL